MDMSLDARYSERRMMVDCQIRTFDVTDALVISRFLEVPREMFLPAGNGSFAYSDRALTLRQPVGRTLLAPLVLARMLAQAEPGPSDHVLVIAGAAGYATALLSGLVASVTMIEASDTLRQTAIAGFAKLNITNVSTSPSLASLPSDENQFDLVLIEGAVEIIPDDLQSRIKEGGRIVAILRSADDPTGNAAKATRFERIMGELRSKVLFDASAALVDGFGAPKVFSF